MIVDEVQRKFRNMKEAGLQPSAIALPGMPVSQIIKRAKPPALTDGRIDIVAWFAQWLCKWSFFAFPDEDVRDAALHLGSAEAVEDVKTIPLFLRLAGIDSQSAVPLLVPGYSRSRGLRFCLRMLQGPFPSRKSVQVTEFLDHNTLSYPRKAVSTAPGVRIVCPIPARGEPCRNLGR